MRIWNLFKINKVLRTAKQEIEDVHKLNAEYEALSKEQNELLVDARNLIHEQRDVIHEQKTVIAAREQTIEQLREQLGMNNRTTYTAAPPGAAPPGANEPMNPFY